VIKAALPGGGYIAEGAVKLPFDFPNKKAYLVIAMGFKLESHIELDP